MNEYRHPTSHVHAGCRATETHRDNRVGITAAAARARRFAARRIVAAATMVRFLDPHTTLFQTDDPAVGAGLASEPGYWPVPMGLVDPLAQKPVPRIVHAVFRKSAEPSPDFDESTPSPLFKVNQVGYLPDAPKFAYIGTWLGPKFGAWKPHSPLKPWQLVEAGSGRVAFQSVDPPRLRVPDSRTKDGVPVSGEETYEMDFSQVSDEGVYFVRVPGLGRSEDFRIAASAAEDAFRIHMLGLYQKRCGIAKTEPFTHWTAGACHVDIVRGTFAPEEGTLVPKTRWFDIIRDNTDWERGEKLRLPGGWHDAADYDRRGAHLNIVGDLCAIWLLKPENFRDGQLRIPENANGIPDILDEAEWGLRHLLAGQQHNGGVGTWIESTRHPVPGNVAERDQMRYALSRATRGSSLAYAAHAALLARCHPDFRTKYLDSAVRAWHFAITSLPAEAEFEVSRKKWRFFTERHEVTWIEPNDLPAEFLVKAAVNLAALTGDPSFLKPVLAEKERIEKSAEKEAWKWPALLFSAELSLGVPEELDFFFRRWKRRRLNVAREILNQTDSAHAYRAPWWAPDKGWFHAMGYGHCHPLVRAQSLVAAHALTGDPRFRDAACLALDFHNGCNPQGTTLTSGLGRVYPVAFLDLPSYVDGIAEYVPGITPYRWTYAVPQKAVDMIWGGDRAKASAWPIWRRWGNLENQTVGASEYTVWETIGPAASVCGYLATPSTSPAPPPPSPPPAAALSDLPGYWTLP